MKNVFPLLVLMAFTAAFCSSPKGITTPEGVGNQDSEEKDIPNEAPQNTFIQGVFIGEKIDRESDVVNNPGRREAYIEIQEIVQTGSNYHGQFHAGDQIKVFFEKGWSGDNSGQVPLNKGDLFKAELIETETRITVYHYDKI